MKRCADRLHIWSAAIAGMIGVSVMVEAQIPVGASGSGIMTFDTHPAAAEWSTYSIGETVSFYSNNSELDPVVQTNAATRITDQVTAVSFNPPGTSRVARW